jgi:hypothetical protein
MAFAERVRGIITRPAAEWPLIAMEPATPASLYSGYIVPLALITPVCTVLSYAAFLHVALLIAIVIAAVSFLLELAYVFVVALIADALAPSFNGVKDGTQGLKWIAYSLTPRWLAGILTLVPGIGPLLVLVASIYSLYVLYLGAVPMMRVPQEKAVNYTIVLVLCVIILGIAIAAIVGAVVATLLVSAAMGLHSLTR